MIKPFKIKVENESHSREIQEWLFSLGHSWNGSSTDVDKLGKPYLFFNEGPTDIKPSLTYGSSDSFYEKMDLPEAWFYDGQIRYEPKPQTLPEFKIKVESPEHSRKIQEFVFKHGYTWVSGVNQVKDTNVPFLFLFQDLEACKDEVNLYTGNYEYDFVEDKLPEKWFYDGKLQDSPEVINDPRSYLMLLLGTDEDIEYKNSDGEWKPFEIKSGYRVKPKPRYCNGVELDPCLTEAPELGKLYYHADPINPDCYSGKYWENDTDDKWHLELEIAYIGELSAAKHGRAMLGIMEG